ncbi:Hydro-lyase, Fe-S type, tartrate/fumarate subfamily, alpha subunit [Bosea sp. LC85]|uniref:fumarate hydratase n=1 Tax=Bosea sp. LC85 TaxID=1502851 RepID=UPI0004E3F14D|nr:fumarate hydratase [Bosea sp. LC85]KFC70359.1 Hydro-lyase, Fe-S type, tartrate/fumarate subfamily, alpha subunit [Bosea sp. LC85]
MAITYDLVKEVTANLYDWSLRRIPETSKSALRNAVETETVPHARQTLAFMLESAETAERTGRFLCSDAGVPSYAVKIGSGVRMQGDIRRAIVDGFEHLVQTIQPPILRFVTHPLTNERSYKGKDMPLVSYDLLGDVDYMDITCAPKALGGGRWAAIETLVSPSLDEIERCILEMVMRAGGQHCPPVVIGVGIGGTFDHAAKLSKDATLRPFGEHNPEPMVADMEERLTRAVNQTGFGPMGVGGSTTTFGVHVEYASGHGFTPVAVSFNCWINRRTRAKIHNSGVVERIE